MKVCRGNRAWLWLFVLFNFLMLARVELLVADEGFQAWIEDFYSTASKDGIKKDLYQKAFEGVLEPDSRVLKKANYQPEFKTKIWDYVDARVNRFSIGEGQRLKKYFQRTLENVEKRFGVSKNVILAIWSMESDYGRILDRPERLHYVPRALATLAYKDPKRKRFARNQLVASLKILQAGDVERAHLNGSWAGAMGHTQFIPTSYLAYGVDMDGNGKRDIWHSIPDALATAANLLHENGWRTGKTWGYEIVLPEDSWLCKKMENQTKLLSEWATLGFLRPSGRSFKWMDDNAVLKMPAGMAGPGFLMMKNFYVLKRYNNADAYALAVGLLADRISGFEGLKQPWPKPEGALSFDEKLLLQELLSEQGLYSGRIDGNLGKGSRLAIVAFQRERGLPEDDQAFKAVLEKLSKK